MEGSSLPTPGADAKKRQVTYFYEPTVGNYYYGDQHPMKPFRVRLTHELVRRYNLDKRMEIVRPYPAEPKDMQLFHSKEYIEFLSKVAPDMIQDRKSQNKLRKFNLLDSDCPVFDGLFKFCQASAGGSIGAAQKLKSREADIAINWAGGLHHAKKTKASGFCYVNDIVLGILELLTKYERVLYVDIDIHHGDGVEEAFYTTDRVMTVSFHRYGEEFFPGSGHIDDIGVDKGKFYSLNVPLDEGIKDDDFRSLFRPILQKVYQIYQPGAIVLQCGADSLGGDRLGRFNLSVKGHAECVHLLRSFNVPLMVLGGGGYTIRNVARCWCFETAVAVGIDLDDKLPDNDYYSYFGPDFTLHALYVKKSSVDNKNTKKQLEDLRNKLLEKLSKLPPAPSSQFQDMPTSFFPEVAKEAEEPMEKRPKPHIWNGQEDDSDVDEEEEKLVRQSFNANESQTRIHARGGFKGRR